MKILSSKLRETISEKVERVVKAASLQMLAEFDSYNDKLKHLKSRAKKKS